MSILIKGIEMPKDGEMLCVNIYPDGKVCINLDLECKRIATAVLVPPHGRLIDADALDASLKEMSEIEWNQKAFPVSWAYAFDAFRGIIERDEPTVIPAEEDE